MTNEAVLIAQRLHEIDNTLVAIMLMLAGLVLLKALKS